MPSDAPSLDLVIRSSAVLTEHGRQPASVAIAEGLIVAVGAFDAPWRTAEEVVLPEGQVLIPGAVDTHVHVNEPGRTEWEGFASATRAAAAGGVTTIIDMPLNSIPPTTTVAGLEAKRAAAAPRPSSMWASGAGRSPATWGRSASCTTPASSASSASSRRAVSTSSAPQHRAAVRGDARDRRIRRPADRPRRGPGRARSRARTTEAPPTAPSSTRGRPPPRRARSCT
ncbi:amidohydrolase family protein [Rathayibacter oskolensis]|uniref:amidohydrolase family protein n=1 Tax=Rathayibacter oskolensis TaxID=1891671 RepID=UPI0034672E79